MNAVEPLEALASKVLEIARKAAPEAQVHIDINAVRADNTRFAVNRITSGGDVEEVSIVVETAIGNRHASASSNQADDASVRALIDRSLTMAKLAPPDPEWMPPVPAQTYAAVPNAFDPAIASARSETRATLVQAAIQAAQSGQLEIAGFLETHAQTRLLANSAGLRARFADTQASLTLTARTSDGTGSGWAGAFSHRLEDIHSAELARQAVDKALRSAKPKRLEPGKYTVVLEPAAVANLISFLRVPLDARSVDEGRSALTKPGGGSRLGEKIAADIITITADPSDPIAPSAPFDDDGLPRRPITFIDKGHLAALRYSRYWASKRAKETMGDPSVYRLAGGQAEGTKELIAGVERGLLVTRFWYTRWLDMQSALVTGLTRDGVFLIENGQLVSAVKNFRFNESPLTMLKNCDALGKRPMVSPERPNFAVPPLRTHDFHMSSVSDAV